MYGPTCCQFACNFRQRCGCIKKKSRVRSITKICWPNFGENNFSVVSILALTVRIFSQCIYASFVGTIKFHPMVDWWSMLGSYYLRIPLAGVNCCLWIELKK